MSSTAILLSGQFRTFATCLPTQHWHVYRHFPDCHFFLVMQKTLPKALTPNAPDPINSEAMVALLEEKYGKERVHAKLIDDPTGLPMIPKKYGVYAPYQNAASHPQLMLQHWYQNEAWKFYRDSGTTHDTVIRMRGDNFFKEFKKPAMEARTAYSAGWARFGGINDRFSVMDYDAAKVYFTMYEKIDELLALGCPFHPESLLKGALELGGITSDDTLYAVFDSYRVTGNHRSAESEMLPWDIATAPQR